MATYAYIDVSRKQEFIYKHNKLRDNLHNSFIIKSVTEEMEEANVCADEVSLTAHLKKHHQAQSEVVYSGGGNSIVRFDTWGQGERFARGYSKEILEAHPDLELYISLVDAAEVDVKGEEQEKQIRQLLHAKADRLKEKRRARFRRWTYGVEKIDETGQAERSCAAQRQTGKQSKYYLHQRLEKELKNTKIEITDELQHYKKDEEGKSYIGVLVIDGNKMGEMAQRIDTFKQLAVFSGQVESIYAEAVIEALKACSDKRAEESPPLYITPVLMAGDDVCLITQAEHAIEIAADILKNINSISGGDE